MASITLPALCVQLGLLLVIVCADPAIVGQMVGEADPLRYIRDASPAAILFQQHCSPSLNVRRILETLPHSTSFEASLDPYVATIVARGSSGG